ncbi:MAG: TonB-dependent receptor, partial [Chitinophagaceae bacterium]|nr:TonB-dependent receptor [Chitinophagaceae bacterium]
QLTKATTIKIITQNNKTPVGNATLYSDDFRYWLQSNDAGVLTIDSLPAAWAYFNLSHVGYKTIKLPADSLLKLNTIEMVPTLSSLSEVVVNASGRQGIFKTISDLDIHLRPIVNSQEVLRIVPGLFIGQHAGGGKAEQIFLRGFDIDHGTDIQITVDGLPVNMVSHAHGQGYADLHFVIPELIQRVDFNKGPYFADKGNFATAGYVGFKTKDYLEQNFIKTEAGQFNTWRAVAAVNLLQEKQRSKNQSLYLSGEASFTDGFFESPQKFSRLNGLLKYHGQAGRNTVITALVSGFTSKWNASGQIPDRAVKDGTIGWYGAIDDTEGGKTSRYNASVSTSTGLGNGWNMQHQMYYSRYLFELYSNFTFFLDNPADGDQIRQKESRHLLGYSNSFSKWHTIGNKRAQFQAGIQSRADFTGNSELSATKNRTVTLEEKMLGDIAEANLAVFAEDKVEIGNKWQLTLGLRGDGFANRYKNHLEQSSKNSQSFIVSPKLNLNYRLNKKVQLYWYNGQGFHSNDTRVAVQQNGRRVVTPAWGSDMGAIIKLGDKAIVQTAIWYLWMQQEFVYVGDAGVVEPGGKTRRMGWDFSIRYEPLQSIYLDADVNLTRPRAIGEPEGANYIPLAPLFSSTGGITYKKQYGLNGSLRYRWLGNRPANEDNSINAEGYFVADAAINYTKKRWEAGIAIQNIFNQKWKETQFDTESRLQQEPVPVSEIHFTPGTPFFARASLSFFF